MGIEQRNVQEDGGFSQTELMRARDEDAARLREQWAKTEDRRPPPTGERLRWDGERYRHVPMENEGVVGPIHGAVTETLKYLDELEARRQRKKRMLEAQE